MLGMDAAESQSWRRAYLGQQRIDKGHALLVVRVSRIVCLVCVLLAVPPDPHVLPALRQLAPRRHPLLIPSQHLRAVNLSLL